MSTKKKVTLLMCVYNGEEFVEETIQSVLNQCYRDYEFVIINDGSNDKTEEILEKYQKKYDNFIVINQDNKGLVRSLNIGLENASGEYIARIDADDLIVSGRLEKQVAFMEQHKDTAVIGTNHILINSSGRELSYSSFGYLSTEGCLSKLREGTSPFAHSSWFIRKSAMLYLNGYDEFYSMAEDYEFLLRCSEKYSIACLADHLVKLRKLENSMSSSPNFSQFKFANVALLQYKLRSVPAVTLPTKEELFAAVEQWFIENHLSKRLLSNYFMRFGKYDIFAGQILSAFNKIVFALAADPLYPIHHKSIRKLSDKAEEVIRPYISQQNEK